MCLHWLCGIGSREGHVVLELVADFQTLSKPFHNITWILREDFQVVSCAPTNSWQLFYIKLQMLCCLSTLKVWLLSQFLANHHRSLRSLKVPLADDVSTTYLDQGINWQISDTFAHFHLQCETTQSSFCTLQALLGDTQSVWDNQNETWCIVSSEAHYGELKKWVSVWREIPIVLRFISFFPVLCRKYLMKVRGGIKSL